MQRRAYGSVAVVLLAAICARPAWAAPDTPVPAPPWVDRAALPAPARAVPSGETEYLLVDTQIRLGARNEVYTRIAQRLHNAEQIADSSQISIDFQPGVEDIAVHEFAIVRQGQRIDVWPTARRAILHREEELDAGIVDDARTLSVILHDVRAGDILDYSYTRARADRLTGGRYADRIRTRWNANVALQRVRLLDASRWPIRIAPFNEAVKPVERTLVDGSRELTWTWNNLRPRFSVDREPDWYYSGAFLQFSHFPDWASVSRWAEPFYQTPDTLPPELAELAATLSKEPDDASRVVRALRFLQDEVRYTGIEVGDGAFVPTAPEVTLKRRFGDCKDKVLLLLTLLRASGIEAHAALVQTHWPLGRDARIPGTNLFNHVIARVRVDDRLYWLDPTVTNQGGDLAHLTQAYFGSALVIHPDTESLEAMPVPLADRALVDVHELFHLHRADEGPARLEVTTLYRGSEADQMRTRLQRDSVDELTRAYRDFYAERFDQVTTTHPVKWTDDREGNEIRIVEAYEIGKPFVTDGARSRFDVSAHVITDRLPDEPAEGRQEPLGISHPMHVVHEIEVRLGPDWSIPNESRKIEAPGVEFQFDRTFTAGRLNWRNVLRSTRDAVPVKELEEFRRQISAIDDQLWFSLSEPADVGLPAWRDLNPWYFLALLGGAGIAALLVWWVMRHPVRLATEPVPGVTAGIRGWLLLLAFSTWISPIVVVLAIGESSYALHIDNFTETGTGLTSEAAATAARVLSMSFFGSVWALLVLSLHALVLMIRRSERFPRSYIVMTWANVASVATATALAVVVSAGDAREINAAIASLVITAISALLWTTYVRVSKRVRATYLTARGESPPPAPMPEQALPAAT